MLTFLRDRVFKSTRGSFSQKRLHKLEALYYAGQLSEYLYLRQSSEHIDLFEEMKRRKLSEGWLSVRPREAHVVSGVSAAPGFSIPNYTVRVS